MWLLYGCSTLCIVGCPPAVGRDYLRVSVCGYVTRDGRDGKTAEAWYGDGMVEEEVVREEMGQNRMVKEMGWVEEEMVEEENGW